MNSKVEFTRLGFTGCSFNFKTRIIDIEEVKACLRVIGEYNEFKGGKIADELMDIVDCISGLEIGRENSPVMYIHLPYWTNQLMVGGETRHELGRRYTREEQEIMKYKVKMWLRQMHADEVNSLSDISEHGNEFIIRGWWD